MVVKQSRLEMPLRLVAAGVTVASLALLTAATSGEFGPVCQETIFCLVFAVCTGFALVVRGLGPDVGSGLGMVIALSVSIVLAAGSPTPSVGHAAFTLAATIAMVLIGRAVGREDAPQSRSAKRQRARKRLAAASERSSEGWTGAVAHAHDEQVERTLGTLITDFCTWSTSDIADKAVIEGDPWAPLARFVRQALRQRLQADDTAVYQLTPDGQKLRVLAPSGVRPEDVPSASSGAIGYALQTGSIFVNTDAQEHAPTDNTWDWVLPIHRDGLWTVVVVARGVRQPQCNRPSVAHAVRDVLQLCWSHVRGMQALALARRTDQQSGLLTRSELMAALRSSDQTPIHAGEPTVVIAFALEGLRRLDDQGQWAVRDELVRRFGAVLRQHLHRDDLVARFADDRFIALMPRLDSRLGATVAQQLVDAVQRQVLKVVDPNDALKVRVRGSLVSGAFEVDSADDVLGQAFALLDEARQRGVAFTYQDHDNVAQTTTAETVTAYVHAPPTKE